MCSCAVDPLAILFNEEVGLVIEVLPENESRARGGKCQRQRRRSAVFGHPSVIVSINCPCVGLAVLRCLSEETYQRLRESPPPVLSKWCVARGIAALFL